MSTTVTTDPPAPRQARYRALFLAPLEAADRLARSLDGRLVVLLFWAVLVFPAIALRGFHYEEGLAVGLARGALREGHWLEPHLYGIRFTERPNLLAWTIAALAGLTGSFHPVVVRLPTVAALLGGALLVYGIVMRRTSRAAGLAAALFFLASPMIIPRHVTAVPDLLLAVLIFWAFVVWWEGQTNDGPGLARWTAVGAILAAAALLKGPQPLAFFALGAGAFVLVERRWRQVPGLMLAGVVAALPTSLWYLAVFQPGDSANWARYMRLGSLPPLASLPLEKLDFATDLALNLLPGLLLAVPFAAATLMRRSGAERNGLVLALTLYAGLCTLVLLLWPSDPAVRYAMPAAPAVAALAGLAFHAWRGVRPWLVALVLWGGAALSVYPVAAGWIVAPFAPQVAQRARIGAYALEAAIRTEPGVIHAVFDDGLNVLAYLDTQIRGVPRADDLATLAAPAWVFTKRDHVAAIAAARPELRVVRHVAVERGNYELVRLLPRTNSGDGL